MEKKSKKIILTIFILVLAIIFMVVHSYYFIQLYCLDEIWNYGFSKSILDGLIPYKDFNMIIPPLFPYINAIYLGIFGKNLLNYNIFIAIISVAICYIAYKKIGWNATLIYVLLLIYSTNGYNTFSLLLLFLLLSISSKQDKKSNILSAIIISAMILTKQTLGLLIIPSLFYNKNKKETFLVYIIAALSLLGYLILQDNLIQFIDYCFLGMFEFANKNAFSIKPYLILEIITCLILLFIVIKTKGQKKDVFYTLMYQIVAFPITDLNHFILALAPVIYLIFKYKHLMGEFQTYFTILLFVFHIFILGITDYNYGLKDRQLFENFPLSSFLEGKVVPTITKDYLKEMKRYRENYKDYKLYVLGNYAYTVKLFLEEPITKYDLINNGNLGYQGSEKYIKEMKNTCQKEKCMFIVNTFELSDASYRQTNTEILKFPIENYNNIVSSLAYSIYTN